MGKRDSLLCELYALALEAVAREKGDGGERYARLAESLEAAFITPLEREDILALAQLLCTLAMRRTALDRIMQGDGADAGLERSLSVCYRLVCELFAQLCEYPKSREIYDSISSLREESGRLWLACMGEAPGNGLGGARCEKRRRILCGAAACADICRDVSLKAELVLMKNS